jgi:hypothetical protein
VASKELTGYRFLDKDPIVDLYREALRKSGLDPQDITNAGGPTVGTLLSWDRGNTRKPQRLSMAYAMMALGYHEEWINSRTGDVLKPRFKDFPTSKVVHFEDAKRAALARNTPRKTAKG